MQRYQIKAFLKAGMKQKMIAQEIGVHPSTISREFSSNIAKRGRTSGAYIATNVQCKNETTPSPEAQDGKVYLAHEGASCAMA